MVNFKLSSTEAAVAVAQVETVGNFKDDAMIAFINLFGANSIEALYADPGSEEHDDAWNALGALETNAKMERI